MKLTPDVRTELQEYLDQGFMFIAKDEDNMVCAYENEPSKENLFEMWCMGGECERCHNNYEFLSWDDKYPMEIERLLEG